MIDHPIVASQTPAGFPDVSCLRNCQGLQISVVGRIWKKLWGNVFLKTVYPQILWKNHRPYQNSHDWGYTPFSRHTHMFDLFLHFWREETETCSYTFSIHNSF